MKQVIQSVSGGPVTVIEVPEPVIGPTEVLVQTIASVISPGTEGAVAKLARSNLLQKARARPDLVRKVVKKALKEGLRSTARGVKAKLDSDIPLGYSACGTALEVGEAVSGIRPDDLVATGGAGKANHAHFQAVPGLLCAKVPAGVAPEDAAFATIASIAMHGVRLSGVTPGEKVVVVGLGLIGQLTMRIARAFGCDVAGVDVADHPLKIAEGAGFNAFLEKGRETSEAINHWANGHGADTVIITAATPSSSAIMRTPEICRDRATVVIVGDVGLDLKRPPFYEKELSIRFARSYGPGRYEPSYEDWGVDYPAEYVRWTEGRNMESVLDFIARGLLDVTDLTTQTFAIEDAPDAYKLIEERTTPYLGIRLTYGEQERKKEIVLNKPAARIDGAPRLGFIGAGSFARSVLIPSLRAAGFKHFVSVCSASGLTARKLAEAEGFEKVVPGPEAVIEDPGVDVVVIVTPHDTHANLVERALRAGKHVFCEKPLALSMEELDSVERAWAGSNRVLFVGFNRRYSRPVAMVRDHFQDSGPLVINYRVNAGEVPPDHWYNDRRQGGRLLGEVCHFIDTCIALVGEAPTEAVASGSATGESLFAGDVLVTLRFPGGSLASITYSSEGHPSMEKERVEILGGGHSAVIYDYRRVTLDSRSTKLSKQDKGHESEIQSFLGALSTGASDDAWRETSRATLEAASHLAL